MNTFLNIANEKYLNFTVKLYVWSIVLEPLNYFILLKPHFSAIGSNLSRLLQLLVLIILLLNKLVSLRSLYLHNPFSNISKYYTLYLLMALFAGIYGAFSGAYDLGFQTNIVSIQGESKFYSFTNSLLIRPFFEYFIQFYYFFYFVILSYYLLANEQGINYFFKIFRIMFFICISLGFLDLLIVYTTNDYLLSRHFYEDQNVGNRFHGIAGEPRHAFAYLTLAIAVFYLKEAWLFEYKVSKKIIAVILIAMMWTQSASGIMGLLFAGAFILIFYKGSGWKRIIYAFVIPMSLVLIFYAFSDRVHIYYDSAFQVYRALNEGGEIPRVFRGQMRDIYPVWQRFLEVINFDFLGLIFGTGFLSETVLVNLYTHTTSFNMTPPSSQLVRTFYAVGIVGMFLLVYAFIYPLKTVIRSEKDYKKYFFLMLILLGGFFAQRASVIYIYLGVLIAQFTYLSSLNNELTMKN